MNNERLSRMGVPAPRRVPATIVSTIALMFLLVLALAQAALAAGPNTEQTPSGYAFEEQWALANTGQFGGTAGDDIDATQAWTQEPGGNAAVVVGVVDSGVNFEQPALEHANLYTRSGSGSQETACAGAQYGCSFVGAGGTPSDENGHGTAVAGEIVAGWEDGAYAGLAPESTLIVAKTQGANGQGSTTAEANGLDYVAEHGARVVNVSVTGPSSAAVREAITEHPETLFVAAAGNSATDDDGASASYPCAESAANVICVAASNESDELASFSNYGARAVDLAAPGVQIATLTLEGSSDTFSGTSYAAPLVTGTAALAFAARPKATVAQVKQAILESVDERSDLAGKTVSGGRLNTARALSDLIAALPAAPPKNTSAPTIAGEAEVGQTLTASVGTWTGSPTSTQISWQRCDGEGGHCQTIAGAVGATYQPGAQDNGGRLRAQVLATNAAGSEIAFSAPTAIVGSSAGQGPGASSDEAGGSSAEEGEEGESEENAASSPEEETATDTEADPEAEAEAEAEPSAAAKSQAHDTSKTASKAGARTASSGAKPSRSVTVTVAARHSRRLLVRARSASAAREQLRIVVRCGTRRDDHEATVAPGKALSLALRVPANEKCSTARVDVEAPGFSLVRTLRLLR